ncbi:MAG TPA: laccase domain-containing protein, partial [Acidimicrobiales bacterium]|nr:laccase domain-containing protein [Acidimicrobiales bacterium]
MAPLAATATFRRRAGLDVLTWPILDGQGVDAIVTTRRGGVSGGRYASLNLGLHVGDDPAAVIENRRRAARALGGDLDDLVVARQVHGREV